MLDWLRRGSDGAEPLRSSSAHSDARRVVVPIRGRVADPELLRRSRLRSGAAIFFLGALFVAGAAAAIVGERGWFALLRKQEEAADLRAELVEVRANVDALERSVERLESDPAALERVARERLDMAKPGEIVFLLPPAAGDVAGHDASRALEP